VRLSVYTFFFLAVPETDRIYTLSLHDALPILFGHILAQRHALGLKPASGAVGAALIDQVEGLENFFARYLPAMISAAILPIAFRSEEHTSELQSRENLVCRLLLEKKKKGVESG